VHSNEVGAGLEGLLRHRQGDLTGIMNGVDYDRWSPEKDPLIPQHYSPQDLSGKAACKAALQQEVGLDPAAGTMLCATIGRLAHQKGYDVLAETVPSMMERGVQLLLLGTGDAVLEEQFAALATRYPGHVSAQLRFDDKLAHRIEAGADVFMMPSRFEPCGLNQLYSLRYGTLPLVHAVGGLNDSISEGPQSGRSSRSSGPGARALARQGRLARRATEGDGPRPLLGAGGRPVRSSVPHVTVGLRPKKPRATILMKLRRILNFTPGRLDPLHLPLRDRPRDRRPDPRRRPLPRRGVPRERRRRRLRMLPADHRAAHRPRLQRQLRRLPSP
ncbi:MAG: glycosyltransferase, partial [Deltaproteobacteria bacterium]